MKNNQNSYVARFKLEPPLAKEHCRPKLSKIMMIGRDLNQQIRVEFPTANGRVSAIYTVSRVHDGDPDLVLLGEKIQTELQKCQELSSTDFCKGKIKAQITAEGLTDTEAETLGEFVEHLIDNGQNRKLLVIAPHGGEIEQYTDKQAEYVSSQFSSEHASLWLCKGFNRNRDSAFNSWHITSTEISEKSFPKLNTIFGRGFEFSIAFHGWTQNSICIGGSADYDLKHSLKETIQSALREEGSDIQVNDSDCPEGFNGNSKDNIVNRIGVNGVQIEQSMEARKQYYICIAKAVAHTIRSHLDL